MTDVSEHSITYHDYLVMRQALQEQVDNARVVLKEVEHENRALAQRLGLAEGLLQEIADDSIDPNGNIGHWMMNPAYLVGLRERISNILATAPPREETGEG